MPQWLWVVRPLRSRYGCAMCNHLPTNAAAHQKGHGKDRLLVHPLLDLGSVLWSWRSSSYVYAAHRVTPKEHEPCRHRPSAVELLSSHYRAPVLTSDMGSYCYTFEVAWAVPHTCVGVVQSSTVTERHCTIFYHQQQDHTEVLYSKPPKSGACLVCTDRM